MRRLVDFQVLLTFYGPFVSLSLFVCARERHLFLCWSRPFLPSPLPRLSFLFFFSPSVLSEEKRSNGNGTRNPDVRNQNTSNHVLTCCGDICMYVYGLLPFFLPAPPLAKKANEDGRCVRRLYFLFQIVSFFGRLCFPGEAEGRFSPPFAHQCRCLFFLSLYIYIGPSCSSLSSFVVVAVVVVVVVVLCIVCFLLIFVNFCDWTRGLIASLARGECQLPHKKSTPTRSNKELAISSLSPTHPHTLCLQAWFMFILFLFV